MLESIYFFKDELVLANSFKEFNEKSYLTIIRELKIFKRGNERWIKNQICQNYLTMLESLKS